MVALLCLRFMGGCFEGCSWAAFACASRGVLVWRSGAAKGSEAAVVTQVRIALDDVAGNST